MGNYSDKLGLSYLYINYFFCMINITFVLLLKQNNIEQSVPFLIIKAFTFSFFLEALTCCNVVIYSDHCSSLPLDFPLTPTFIALSFDDSVQHIAFLRKFSRLIIFITSRIFRVFCRGIY